MGRHLDLTIWTLMSCGEWWVEDFDWACTVTSIALKLLLKKFIFQVEKEWPLCVPARSVRGATSYPLGFIGNTILWKLQTIIKARVFTSAPWLWPTYLHLATFMTSEVQVLPS